MLAARMAALCSAHPIEKRDERASTLVPNGVTSRLSGFSPSGMKTSVTPISCKISGGRSPASKQVTTCAVSLVARLADPSDSRGRRRVDHECLREVPADRCVFPACRPGFPADPHAALPAMRPRVYPRDIHAHRLKLAAIASNLPGIGSNLPAIGAQLSPFISVYPPALRGGCSYDSDHRKSQQ
jgi:hypothetical protein